MAFSVIGVSLVQLVGEYLFTQRTRDDQRIAESLTEQISGHLVAFDAQAMYAIASEAAQSGQTRVMVLDPYCVVQVDSQSELNGTRFITAEISSVLSGAQSEYGYYDVGNTGTYWIRAALSAFRNVDAMTGIYANGIYNGRELTGVLVYISRVQEIYESLRDIQMRIILWLVLVTAAVMLVNLFIMHTITRPIDELSEGISRMSRGELSTRVKVRGKNEFSDLAAAFNSMSERLEQLDRSRNQFVSNASHELKTPLSTMKILIETLMYQDPPNPDMTREFLTDVNKEIDRLNHVVSDLLTLVHMDNNRVQLNLVELNLGDLLQEQVRRLSPLARQNGITLDASVRDQLFVNGDTLKLQQVIYNVIDNAIKYTGQGGEVHCTLTRSGKQAFIRISDTGVGIPEEDLPHIFDRFYRVDKARSRETGGTGLGLSIVKQTLLMHGGSIEAKSTYGKGSTFIIALPLSARREE